jgi:hypothetical protein
VSPALERWFPILSWGRRYNRSLLTADGVAAVVVTLLLVAQKPVAAVFVKADKQLVKSV